MKKLRVKVNVKTSLVDLVEGFLFCTDKLDQLNKYVIGKENLTDKGTKLLEDNLVNTENPHMQLMNQVQVKVQIYNTTRAVLQEFARHRLGNEMTVKSTRYALNKIKLDKDILIGNDFEEGSIPAVTDEKIKSIVSNYYYIPIDDFVTENEKYSWIYDRYMELCNIKHYKTKYNMKNDHLKKYINDYMLTNINTVMSGTAIKNFLFKRLDTVAWYQIQNVAKLLYKQIPDDWKQAFKTYKYIKVDKKGLELSIVMLRDRLGTEYVDIGGHPIDLFEHLKELLDKNLVEKIDLTKGL